MKIPIETKGVLELLQGAALNLLPAAFLESDRSRDAYLDLFQYGPSEPRRAAKAAELLWSHVIGSDITTAIACHMPMEAVTAFGVMLVEQLIREPECRFTNFGAFTRTRDDKGELRITFDSESEVAITDAGQIRSVIVDPTLPIHLQATPVERTTDKTCCSAIARVMPEALSSFPSGSWRIPLLISDVLRRCLGPIFAELARSVRVTSDKSPVFDATECFRPLVMAAGLATYYTWTIVLWSSASQSDGVSLDNIGQFGPDVKHRVVFTPTETLTDLINDNLLASPGQVPKAA